MLFTDLFRLPLRQPAFFLAACSLALLTACGGATTTPEDTTAPATESEASEETVDELPDESDGQTAEARMGNIDRFIPPGHSILGSATGDLNKDAYGDMVLILAVDGEENSDPADSPPPRPLLLLLGDEDGAYTEAARNDKVVLCHACGGVFGDPYEGITIKDGYFSIEHYGGSNWRWTRIITFKWSEKDKTWFLHKDGGVSYHTSDPDKMEEKVKTVKDFGVVPFGKFNYEDGE